MRNFLPVLLFMFFGISSYFASAQDTPVSPSLVGVGVYHGLTKPLKDLPAMNADEFRKMQLQADMPRNEELQNRSYPFAETALPIGPDPAWQKEMGNTGSSKAPIVTFDGPTSPYYPPDANGVVGPNHYMQTINSVYAIYSKTGALMAGPTNLNLLFTGVTGATCNDGDPIVLYDEQADRWMVAEFSICGSNDYMLVAVSQTNDPTGAWHKYSFDVADMPDYEKFGIWQDGYYMATNNSAGKDIYVFQRSQMLIGGTAQMVGFDNPNRPTTIDGFVCVPPVDNDGAFAPAGSPGLFVAFNDDAIGGGSDQIWIYELAVNWTTPTSSTFARVQQLSVSSFDSNFGNNWDNIKQPGTTRELDAIPMVVMNAPQYRNFGTHQTLVLCHTVDVDNTDHAGIRWYELRKSGTTWAVRQQGTYAPDAHSRWMGSIRLNGFGEIGLGYSVSSTTVYPGIRYCGQSSAAYTAGAGVLDVTEGIITTGTYSQTAYNRWGDYSSICVDPSNDMTFWYTNQYIGTSSARKTRIASFQIGTAPTFPDLIIQTPAASPASMLPGATTTASCSVKNQGTASAGASVLKYYLSANSTYEATDVLLGSSNVATLAAGASAAASSVVTIPAGTAAGTWYIVFYADADLTVAEGNETNNVGNFQITVTSTTTQPDLVVLTPAASPSTVVSGQTSTASCSVKNQGTASAAASVLKYYLSANNTYEATDALLASSNVATLAAGASAAASSLVTIPAATAAGTWYIVFFADANLAVAESNETNNVGFVAITVTTSSQGCNSTTQYPSSTLTPTTSWKSQKSIYAGEYTAFKVTSGITYIWSYCSADGGVASYDSEITLRNKANDAFIAYSNDACGDDAKITWTATFTGNVKVVTTKYSCGTNTVKSTLRYKKLAKEGIEESIATETEFSIHPNPTSSIAVIESSTDFADVNEVLFYDMNGSLVKTLPLSDKTGSTIEVDLSAMKPGLYYIKLVGDRFSEQMKIVVAR
jgi:hypothetical protein